MRIEDINGGTEIKYCYCLLFYLLVYLRIIIVLRYEILYEFFIFFRAYLSPGDLPVTAGWTWTTRVYIIFKNVQTVFQDLPGVSADPDNHQISGDKTQAIEKYVSSLGDLLPHGPVNLFWMLITRPSEHIKTAGGRHTLTHLR